MGKTRELFPKPRRRRHVLSVWADRRAWPELRLRVAQLPSMFRLSSIIHPPHRSRNNFPSTNFLDLRHHNRPTNNCKLPVLKLELHR